MPQKPQFDPNEFASTTSATTFNPNEFVTSPHQMPSTPPPAGEQASPYKSFWDSVSSAIPQSVKSGWDTIWKPLTNLPSKAAGAVAEPMMQWGENHPDIPYGQAARYGGAYLQSLGNIGDTLTAPGNLALAVGSEGTSLAEGAGLPTVAKAIAGGTKVAGGATMLHGGLQVANPESTLPERGMGALEAIGGAMAMRTPSGSANIPDNSGPSGPSAPTPPVTEVPSIKSTEMPVVSDTSIAPKPFDPTSLGFKGDTPSAPNPTAGTPSFGAKPEAEFVNPKTGEVKAASQAELGDVPTGNTAQTPTSETPVGETKPTEPKIAASLPNNLKGAKPRFNIGYNSYEPTFTDDLDKALYIIAQQKPSRADAQYLSYVMDQTGLDEQGARSLGQQVKRQIKQQAQGQPAGVVKVQPIGRFNKAVQSPATPEEVTQSLSQRLQKVAADPSSVDQPAEISKLTGEAKQVLKDAPEENKPGIIRQVLNANKSLLTSWDFSAPGRQGKSFITNKAWWTSLDDMFKAWGSKEGAELVNQSIEDHPSGYFKHGDSETGKPGKSFAEKAGLQLASHEEMFSGKLTDAFEKYTLVGKSSRAHTAFLNKLRSDQFASMMESAKKAGLNPETNMNVTKGYADFINAATGRGNLGKLQRNTQFLNDVFFAPRNMAGQIQTWNNVLNPIKYANYDPVLRKQSLQSLFAIAGVGMGVGELARLGGAQVSNDPTSADFRKIKIGDSRIDPFGGYQQFPVAAMKLLMGKSTSSISGKTADLTSNKFGQQTRASVAETFFTNRLSPVGSFIWAWMSNREFDGKPFDAKRAAFERVFPIAAKDIVDLAKTDPALAAATAIPTMFGLTGTQHYTGR